MKLSNFKSNFSSTILKRGKSYYNLGKVINVENISEYENKVSYEINVKGSELYTVSLTLENYEKITHLSCDCPYGGYCKHEAAALYKINEILSEGNKIIVIDPLSKEEIVIIMNDNTMSKKVQDKALDRETKKLIDIYSKKNRINTEIEESINNIHLYPSISKIYTDVVLEMKIGEIGKKRTYVVSNIYDFIERFKYKKNYRYGKELALIHTYNVFDEQSKTLIHFVKSIYEQSGKSYYNKKLIEISNEHVADFFKIYIGETVVFENVSYNVVLQDYKVKFKLEKYEENLYSLSALPRDYYIISSEPEAVICDLKSQTAYICSEDYSEAMADILKTLNKNDNRLFITEKDMPAFYKNIFSMISGFCEIQGFDSIDHIKPPELKAALYLDMPKDDSVTAALKFFYDEEEFDPYYIYNENPLADIRKETIIKNKAEKYFQVFQSGKGYNLVLKGNDNIYRFLSEGIAELSEKAEIFTSENFKKISVCKKVSISVGVHMESNLLELEFDVGDYSTNELERVLSAYNKGLKYYRLKNGEFINLDDKLLEEFTELKDALNIKSNDILSGKTNVPKYRMLYLDALRKNNDELNINESKELYKEIKKFKSLSDTGDFELSEKLDNIMREYQKDGFRWFKTICKYNFGGILADDMGLGKTIQAIALMQNIKDENPDKKFLVICPASLVLNWENEIKKFAPDLKSLALVGNVNERKEKTEKISRYDVIITSYSLIVNDINSYKKLEFCIHFIDEAQYIKNHNTQAAKAVKLIKSETRFALTGTPIENSLAELWSIFDFIMPGYLYEYKYFKNNFEVPIVKSKDTNKTKALQKITAPFILRRMKKEVLKELPDKMETILKSEMYDTQRKLYLANLVNFKNTAKEKTETEGEKSRFEVLAMITKLRQLCCDPKLVYDDYDGGSAKLEQCIDLVSSCVEAGHKILLFSQFTSMLDIIKKRLDNDNISNYILTGKTKTSERLKMVNRFNGDDTNVFLISLKAGGTGLNLTGADIVIHYDPWWNISAENQASDRAYRIGQQKNVQIYKLISENTIEERIHALQQAKAELTEIANGGENIMQMSLSDILDLFE